MLVVDDGRLLGRPADGGRSRAQAAAICAASLVVNLGMLGFFKYFNFFVENVRTVLAALGIDVAPPTLEIVLPVGISFYTFQALSYTIDIYRGEMRARATRSTSRCSSRSSRSSSPGRSCARRTCCSRSNAAHVLGRRARRGAVLIAWGFFKKLVVADNVAPIADRVFGHPGSVLRAAVGRRLRLRRPDLRRLLRLLRHRARHRALVRLRADRQLQPPLHRAQPDRFLAALAHLAVDLVPRLRLHPARRQPRALARTRDQPAGDVSALGPVARRELELRAVGRLPRRCCSS